MRRDRMGDKKSTFMFNLEWKKEDRPVSDQSLRKTLIVS